MKRHLAVLAVVLGLLVLADFALERRSAARRMRTAAVRPVVGMEPEAGRSIHISTAGQRWSYVLRDSVWRYPAYFDAYVQRPRIEQFLRSLLVSSGSVVAGGRRNGLGFGFDAAAALQVSIRDQRGRVLVEATVGRGIPGRLGAESYLRKAGEDTVFHLHDNPRLALGDGPPPMLDRHLLPQALARGATVRLGFAGSETQVEAVWRVELTPDTSAAFARRGPHYQWRARVAGREAVCANNSVYAYLRYLSRLQYGHLLAADAGTEDFEFGGLVTLEDDRGVKDTLDVVQKNADEFMVRHRLARQVSTLTAAQASLLFPAADAVLDTLQEPSRYERVAPRAPGLF